MLTPQKRANMPTKVTKSQVRSRLGAYDSTPCIISN